MAEGAEVGDEDGDFDLTEAQWALLSRISGQFQSRKRWLHLWVNCLFFAVLLGFLVFLTWWENQGNSTVLKGWLAFPGVLLMISPIVAGVIIVIRGEKRIMDQIQRAEGVVCMECGQTPQSMSRRGVESTDWDWIVGGHCECCGAEVPLLMELKGSSSALPGFDEK